MMDRPRTQTAEYLTRYHAEDERELATPIVFSALQLGVIADFLLRANGLGLNGFLLVTAIAVVTVRLLNRADSPINREVAVLLLIAVASGFALIWRDAEELKLLNVG